ncbi:hypothetical protein [Flavobacterium sp. H122]|uniref:hypothetical protein n=1 Tax=Flavobacterium sp. H122 TaxID=2529860 RepID=UPI0010A9E520|nr:hypothetical protein [Flavobacterium sp. H122]
MKLKLYILITISFLIFSCKKTETVEKNKTVENNLIHKKQLVSEKEIYEVINVVLGSLKHDELIKTNYVTEDVLMKFNFKEKDYKLDTLFSKKDIQFIRKQLIEVDNFRLNQNLLISKVVIPRDTLSKFQNNKSRKHSFWDNYTKKYGNKGFYTMGLPLFSLDKKTVIITSGFHCGGLCGVGTTEIYKKVNGKWTSISTLESWVS